MENKPITIYTVGHGNQTLPEFIDLLKSRGIKLLVDVRSVPYSKYARQFNREELRQNVEKAGIDYEYMGDVLGGRPRYPEYYNGRTVDYEKIRNSREYREGLERLKGYAQKDPTAVMCGEEDPAKCHRSFLLTQSLLRDNVKVAHIRSDGTVEEASILPLTAFW